MPARSADRPCASIVVVTYGRRDVTEVCLQSLEMALGDGLGSTWELVLVDNASPDDTLELLHAWSDRATIVALPENRNFAGGCNAGAEAARGETLVFLNNDTTVPAGALEALVEQAREPGVGAAGPRLLYPDGTIQHAGVWMVRESETLVVPYHVFHHEPGDHPPAAITTDLDCVTAACLAMPATVFRAIGGYDTAYRNGWEDVDLCLRVRLAGHRVVYRGDIVVVHDEGATRGRKQGLGPNAAIFYARWGEMLDDDRESFERIFDAGYLPLSDDDGRRADIAVVGPVATLGTRAAQGRAVVAALEALGRTPGVREPDAPTLAPRLTRDEWGPTLAARGRQLDDGVPEIDPAQLPAIVCPPGVGPGGGGVLAVLPAQDLDRAAQTLDAAVATGIAPLVLCPTVATDALAALVAARVPGAQVLNPITSEAMLGALSQLADVVVAADPADRWDRAALVAAGAGAAVVVRPDGPALELLGDLATPLGTPVRALHEREVRHLAVRDGCSPERVLGDLVPPAALNR
jgi:GT2 family glycosyltransferase